MNTSTSPSRPPEPPAPWLDLVRQHVNSLHFGTVAIVVHDGRVVQIEKTERVRLGAVDGSKVTKVTAPATTRAPTVPGRGTSTLTP